MIDGFETNTPVISIIHIIQTMLDMDSTYCHNMNCQNHGSHDIPFLYVGCTLPIVYTLIIHCRTLLESYYKFIKNNKNAELKEIGLSPSNNTFAFSLFKIRNDFSHGWHNDITTINQINLSKLKNLDKIMTSVLQESKIKFDENYSKKLIACTLVCIKEISDKNDTDNDRLVVNKNILLLIEKLISS